MKARLSFLLLLLVLGFTKTNAQIPNPGFELLNVDGSVSNWGNVYLFSVTIDTNGVSTVDSIVFDNQFYAPTTDAHSGNYAMEMRNAFNFTTGTGIAGIVSSDTDAVYTAWGSLEFVPIQTYPTELGFYYKFFPVNGDTASVEIIIYDEFGTEIGIGAALVGGLVSSYTYLSVPIVYSGSSLPAYYSLNFTTAGYGFQPSFGTRFLIDDLILNDATGIKDETTNIFNLYPNPASDVLNLDVSEMRDHATYKIIDMSGKLIDTGSISKTNNYISTKTVNDGLYLLEFITGEETQHRLFVVRH